MNTDNATRHLNDDELLEAVVDVDDLKEDRRSHLKACPACTEQLETLQGRLAQLGRTAERMAPAPRRPFRLSAESKSARRRSFAPLWAMGLSAAILLGIVVLNPRWGLFDAFRNPTFDAAADRVLMEEIDALVSNALPVRYQQLALLSESDNGGIDTQMDDELLDWIVPPIDDGDQDESII